MDIDEAKEWAAEYTIRALVSGKDFNGLAGLAKAIIMSVASSADINAKHICEVSIRTSALYGEMEDKVVQEFVFTLCGFHHMKRDPIQAAHHIVQTVWDAYISWAQQAKTAAERMKAVLSETGLPATPAGIRAATRDLLS